MRPPIQFLSIPLVTLLAIASTADAGTISGRLSEQGGGAAVAGVEVRAWLVTTKGLEFTTSATSDANGAYSLTVPAGTYRVDARGAPTYTDRWHDVMAPVSAGYVAANADDLVVGTLDTLTGIDILMEAGGGGDGRVTFSGAGLGGPMVRMERKLDYRIHHNDASDGPPVDGRFSFRGMPPGNDYQIMVYDPSGTRETLLVPGPFTITSGGTAALGDRGMAAYSADPYEGNNSGNCTNTLVDENALHANPPVPWQTGSAYIGPLGSDADWYCFQAVEGDRLLLTATTEFTFDGVTRYHPWTDPMMAWWSGTGGVKLAEDDDSGPGHYDAFIDTGALDPGCYCLSVSTFGDNDYNGTGQGSSGRYTLEFAMGNRPPLVKVFKGATEVPYSPGTLTMAEGQELSLTLQYPDADEDALATSFSHTDNLGTQVVDGVLNLGLTGGTYVWMAGPAASAGSPYTLVLQADDSEFSPSRTISLVVTQVNDPPEPPILISLIGGEVTTDPTPTLTLENGTDPDGDALSYDIELYYDDIDSAVAQTVNQPEGMGGMTTWQTDVIPENTRVYWRARANDGNGGVSAWTDFDEFVVDTANDPPEAPILTKPANGALVLVRRPGLSAINVTDPEDESIDFFYEVATDFEFNDIIWASDPVPMSAVANITMAALDQDLDWGGTYFARAWAQDARGGVSDYSNINQFRLKENLAPGTPTFAEGCVAATYTVVPPTSIEVVNVIDPEAEAVTLQLQIHPIDVDPDNATPLVTVDQEMAAGEATRIEFDASELANGTYRVRIRAFDGTDTSEWLECEFTLELPDEIGEATGGCCQSGPPEGSIALALMLLGLAVLRRRALAE